ncbi:MAG: hypothetical protein ACRDHP_10720 [Ktedonobacterales bacterium]
MARKPQQERLATSTTPSTRNLSTPAADSKLGFLARFVPARVIRATATSTTGQGAQAAKPKGVWRRLIFGMLIFIIAMQVFEYVLIFIGAKFNLNLSATMGKNIPIIGSLSWFTFIYLLFMLVLYLGLLRFNVIPSGKTMRTQRAAATPQPAASAATHADRKRAARHAATTTTTTVSTARRTETVARVKSGQGQVAASSASATGIGDDTYDRVKAAQRTRRRREAKR